jgi:hypothetical protein
VTGGKEISGELFISCPFLTCSLQDISPLNYLLISPKIKMSFALTFLKRLQTYETIQPYELIGFPDIPEADRSNCVFETRYDIDVQNVRGHESLFTLSEHGFCFAKHSSKCLPTTVADRFDLTGNMPPVAYIEETANFVKEKLNAENVICFDWRVSKIDSLNTDIYAQCLPVSKEL